MEDVTRDIQCTYTVKCRVLTFCGWAGSNGHGECEESYTMYIHCNGMYMKLEYENRVLTICGCVGRGAMEDVRRDIKCTCTVECT